MNRNQPKNWAMTITLISAISLVFSVQVATSSSGSFFAIHIDMRLPHYQKKYLKDWLQEFSECGFNAVVWELTDGVKFDTCPEVAAPEAFSKREFQEILKQTEKLELESVPLLQCLGHAEYVLEHSRFAELRDNPQSAYQYCPLKPEVIAFLQSWISEHLDLFGDVQYFHLGGDEASLPFNCPDAQTAVQQGSVSNLYVNHVEAVAKPLLDKGITPMIWSDMLLAHPKALPELSRRFMLFDWEYYLYRGLGKVSVWEGGKRELVVADQIPQDYILRYEKYLYPEGIGQGVEPDPFYTADYLADLGFSVITCGASKTAGDNVFSPRHELHLRNSFDQCKKGMSSHLQGFFLVGWSHHMHPWELQLSCIDIPAFLQQFPDGTLEDYRRYFTLKRFGITDNVFWIAAELLSKSVLFSTSPTLGYGMDIEPVFPTYVKDTLEKLNREGRLADEILNCQERRLDYRDALILLGELKRRAIKGKNLLNLWELAARNLLNRAEVSQLLLSYAAGGVNTEIARAKATQLLNELRDLRVETGKMYKPMVTLHRRELMLEYIYSSLEQSLTDLIAGKE